MKSAFWALPLLFVTAAAQLQPAENEQNVVTVKPVDGFVQVYNGEFVIVQEDNSSERTFCEPFYLVGWNSWDVTRVPRLLNSVGQQFLTQQLETAASSGLNVIRAWAHTVDPDYPVMKGPGEYDEFGLRALDFLLDEASKVGIRVILSFVDNWKYPGGVDQMIDWSETAPETVIARPADEAGDFDDEGLDDVTKTLLQKRHALFYTDEGTREIYRDYVSTLINRKNFYNGLVYKDDPTIFAWNLINEPRCESFSIPDCELNLQNWIESEAAFVKDLDPNHMLTLGGEGFWASGSPGEEFNPTWWAKSMGQNFTLNHSPDLIDFASIHIWPDTWNIGVEETETWIREHMRDTRENLQGKPLLLEEFGKSIDGASEIDQRNEYYKDIHQMVEDSISDNDVLKGSLFWNWEAEVLPNPGSYAISPQDSTFELIKEHAVRIGELRESKPTYVCDGIAVPPFA